MGKIALALADAAKAVEAMAGAERPAPPSVGRIVHFYSQEYVERTGGEGYNGMGAGPYTALVTQVHKDGNGDVTYVNLAVQPPFANAIHEGSVAHTSYRHADARRWWAWPQIV